MMSPTTSKGGVELVEVASLSRLVLIGSRVQSIGESLVIGQHVEWSAFAEMSEMFNRLVHNLQLWSQLGSSYTRKMRWGVM